MPKPRTRRWLYGVHTAVVPLLVFYGIVEEAAAPLWVALGSALLVGGLATANTHPEADE